MKAHHVIFPVPSFFFLSFFLFANVLEGAAFSEPKNFGPFNVSWHKVDLCPDFRVMPAFTMSTKLVHGNDGTLLHVNYTTKAVLHLDKIKIRMLSNEKDRRVLWSYSLEKPCKHLIMGPYLSQVLKNNQCIVPKETRSLVVSLNINTVIGDNFFYGTYIMKASVHERKKNIACIDISFSVLKNNNTFLITSK